MTAESFRRYLILQAPALHYVCYLKPDLQLPWNSLQSVANKQNSGQCHDIYGHMTLSLLVKYWW